MTDQLSLITALPFILTLLSIAIIPLAAPHFWEHNRNKAVIAGLLATPILVYFLGHDAHLILKTVEEYFSFIVLLGSLYVIAGGINISGDLKATPKVNACFLGIGAILANLIGTTGA
ncbi:MAG TPA: sodium:proton antiporter, partial [bacterium]|nr:sodium:proton antiporter [bacterium]